MIPTLSRPAEIDAALLRAPMTSPQVVPSVAMRDMTDAEIQSNIAEIESDLGDIAAAKAEIHSEAAHFGDGPVGSQQKLESMHAGAARLRRELELLGAEWKRRHPPAPPRFAAAVLRHPAHGSLPDNRHYLTA